MDGKFFENSLFAVAGDTGRRLEVQLLDSDNLVQNTTGISLRLNADVAGQATYAEATLVDATKGMYELDLPNGMLLAPGVWQFQWQIIGTTGEKLNSFAFMGTIGSNLSEGGSEGLNFYLKLDDLKEMQEDLISGAFDSAALETNISEKLEALETEYAPNLSSVNSQLTTKIGGGVKGTLNDVDGEFLAAIQGGAGTSFNLLSIPQPYSVGLLETNYPMAEGVPSINLYDTKKTVSGRLFPTNGAIVADSTYKTSDYISVIAGDSYVFSGFVTSAPSVWFSEKGVFLSDGGFWNNGASKVAPTGAKYVRLTSYANAGNQLQFEKGTVKTPYQSPLPKTKILSEYIPDGGITNEKISGVTKTSNLFNYNTVKTGYVVTSASGETVNASYSVSDYIAVKASQKYIVSNAQTTAFTFYTSSETFISAMSVGAGGDNYIFQTPVNTAFVRLNILNNKLTPKFMLVEGETMPVDFIRHGNVIDWLVNKDKSIEPSMLNFDVTNASKWAGKTIATFGDSITWYDGNMYNVGLENGNLAKGYQSYMREKLGCTVINKGVSGYRMPQILDVVKSQNYSGISGVTLTAGANDFRVSESTEPFGIIQPIGSTFDITSFIGSMQDAIEYILAQNPEIKIYLITPIKGWGTSVMPTKFPDAIKDIGKLYSLSVCDWYYNSGINDITKSVYINDPDDLGYKLHPNNKGFDRMDDVLIPVLENS